MSSRSYEHLLSMAGAFALLAVALLGPVGAGLLATAVAFSIVLGARLRAVAPPTGLAWVRRSPADRKAPEADDRWLAWRVVEPDTEYLRGRAA